MGVCIAREQQDVFPPLVVPLSVVMLDVFAQCPPQGAFAEEDHFRQALLLHRPDPTLRIGTMKMPSAPNDGRAKCIRVERHSGKRDPGQGDCYD